MAARFAGHSSNESITIARAAQYVDESSASLIKSELLGVNPGFTPTPTIESFERLAKKNLFTSKSELDDTRIIWTSFHFLPGNFPCDGGRPYEGKRKWLARTIEPAEEWDALLVCRPNSTLAAAMINDLAAHRDENYHLYLPGIRMHVLADTWAHEGFSGTCNWWINDLASTPTWAKSNEPIGFKAGTLKKARHKQTAYHDAGRAVVRLVLLFGPWAHGTRARPPLCVLHLSTALVATRV